VFLDARQRGSTLLVQGFDANRAGFSQEQSPSPGFAAALLQLRRAEPLRRGRPRLFPAAFRISPEALTRPAATLSRSGGRGICLERENHRLMVFQRHQYPEKKGLEFFTDDKKIYCKKVIISHNLMRDPKMKTNYLHALVMGGALAALPNCLTAQPAAHYCPGAEGIFSASLPPPGFYVKDYNVFYTADRLNNAFGQSTGPGNFSVFTYVQMPRLIWMTDLKFLGADVGVDALVPFVDENVTAGSFHGSTFGVGDMFAEGTMAWHPKRFDFAVGAGVWAPTGDSVEQPAPGLGYWTGMFTGGATWYVDKNKTWAVSALNRFELNTAQRDTHITTGDVYSLDWAICKNVWKSVEVGPAGYYQQKVTPDSGPGATKDYNRVAGIGGEIAGVIPKVGTLASVRYFYEFMAENRAQGQTVVVSLTQRF